LSVTVKQMGEKRERKEYMLRNRDLDFDIHVFTLFSTIQL